MNLEYKEYLDSKSKNKIKKIYNNSFPKSERFPIWVLGKCSRTNNVEFNEILYNKELIGIEFIITYKDIAYLMYFAIREDKRNNGYGSKILKELIKKYKTVILSIERVNDSVSRRRKNFYLQNGFYQTNKFTKQNNVYYELLCSNKSYNITKVKLINIYKNMSDSKLLKYLINKKFNLFDIDFIENKL